MNRRFAQNFSSQWIKVKFYSEGADLNGLETAKNVRFCEATKMALTRPVLLDKESISCPGAQFALGYRGSENGILDNCSDKRRAENSIVKTMFSGIAHFKKPFKYIGLNTKDEPDLVMSYVSPEQAMYIVKRYHDKCGRDLDISLSGMMSVCSGIAVKTHLRENVNISFGCKDSREYAQIGRDRLVVGIPRKLFKVFV